MQPLLLINLMGLPRSFTHTHTHTLPWRICPPDLPLIIDPFAPPAGLELLPTSQITSLACDVLRLAVAASTARLQILSKQGKWASYSFEGEGDDGGIHDVSNDVIVLKTNAHVSLSIFQGVPSLVWRPR